MCGQKSRSTQGKDKRQHKKPRDQVLSTKELGQRTGNKRQRQEVEDKGKGVGNKQKGAGVFAP